MTRMSKGEGAFELARDVEEINEQQSLPDTRTHSILVMGCRECLM